MRLIGGVAALLALVGAVVWLGRDLLPPPSLSFAAGGEGGGYWRLAERYRDLLARDGIRVEIIATAGSVENARLLAEGAADAGLLQGGVASLGGTEALGAILYEPMLVFVRGDGPVLQGPGDWAGLTVAAGPEGSGARAAAEAFAEAARLAPGAVTWSALGGQAAAAALMADEVDAALFVAPLSAPYLAPLFASEAVRLADLGPIEAISRRMPQSRVIRLPSGAAVLDPPSPPEDHDVIAMVARLVGREGLHPALVDRLVEAARLVHSRRDALTDEGRFPSVEAVDLPMDAHARRLIEEGPSRLSGWVPWWAAAQIDRVLVLLLPILLLAAPLLRAGPGLWAWGHRRRIWRHYETLREIETAARCTEDPEALRDMARRLAALETDLAEMNLPMSFREGAWMARLHAERLRLRLEAQAAG